MTIAYLWSKLMKKLPLSAIRNADLEKPCKVNAQSTVLHTSMGRYSYCGYGCTFINCKIGRFCSIADRVSAGLASHPMDWVSTSPAFYFGGGRSIPEDLAALHYHAEQPMTVIGNDVWIGQGVLIKPGVTIGNGAVIGMGSVVTHDVPAYAVAAGNPARVIKMRFPAELAARLEASAWWDLSSDALKRCASYMNDPEVFLEEVKKES
ncbi:MAG: CatB-related O-acetyltransferase [Dysosmobacter sp.]